MGFFLQLLHNKYIPNYINTEIRILVVVVVVIVVKLYLCLVKTARIESRMLAKTTRHACNKYRSTCLS